MCVLAFLKYVVNSHHVSHRPPHNYTDGPAEQVYSIRLVGRERESKLGHGGILAEQTAELTQHRLWAVDRLPTTEPVSPAVNHVCNHGCCQLSTSGTQSHKRTGLGRRTSFSVRRTGNVGCPYLGRPSERKLGVGCDSLGARQTSSPELSSRLRSIGYPRQVVPGCSYTDTGSTACRSCATVSRVNPIGFPPTSTRGALCGGSGCIYSVSRQ